MEFKSNFKFLNLQVMQRKNANELPEDEKNYLIINLLDNGNNPCRFFIFNKDLMKKILSTSYLGLQELEIAFELNYSKDAWHVKVVDINE